MNISGTFVPFAEVSVLPTVSSDLSTGNISGHLDSSQRAQAVRVSGDKNEGDKDKDKDECHVLHDNDNMDQFNTVVDDLSQAAI